MELSSLQKSGLQLRGQIGKQWIGYVVHGEQRYRSYVVPTDPQTAPQLARRSVFASGVAAWHSLSSAEKLLYIRRASKISPSMTGFNLFLRFYLKNN